MSGDLKEDILAIIDDPQIDLPGYAPWQILVVDDDEEVHIATRLALGDMEYAGRGLHIISCHSAAEAFTYLKSAPEVVCILLDVMTEKEYAGLDLVRRIREELGNGRVRIILCTGRSGNTPELEVIRDYDVDACEAKSELTAARLMASVLTALRSHDRLMAIEAQRSALEMVIQASADLSRKRQLTDFGAGVLAQLAVRLGVPVAGFLCMGFEDGEPIIIAAAGAFAPYARRPLSELGRPPIEAAIGAAVRAGENIFAEDCTVFYLGSGTCRSGAIFIQGNSGEIGRQRRLIELFFRNIALGFETAQLEERLREAAFADPVTGLKSRAGFVQAADQILSEERNPGRGLVVQVLDIDHFNLVTQRLGLHLGDDLLRAVAARLRAAFPEALVIGRLAGDSFGLALPETARAAAERVEKAFEAPVMFANIQTTISMTGGVSVSQRCGDASGELLVRQASLAMKKAKRHARGRVIAYDVALKTQNDVQMVLVSDLRRGLRRDELLLHYQPKVDLATGKAIGVEALVRWQCPQRSLLLPGSFIGAAEASGLIIPLGRRVFEMALWQRGAWLKQKLDVSVAINFSAVQVQQHDFVDDIDAALRITGLEAAGIEIEVTESCFLGEEERIFHYLTALRKRGFSLALDDFGTGYSSLRLIHRMPLSTIKLDRSFVNDVLDSRRAQVLVTAVVSLAQSVGAKVVAEGIEFPAQAEKLRELGVAYGQGYLFGKPMPADQLAEWGRQTGSFMI